MAGCRQNYRVQKSDSSTSGNLGIGVCMINNSWRDEQRPDFIQFVSSFLRANAYRLNFLPIAPVIFPQDIFYFHATLVPCIKFPEHEVQDFIFNNGGLSVAFIFITNWNPQNIPAIFGRITKLKNQFGHFYAVATICSAEQNESFINSYFKYGIEIGKPTFIIVDNPEMGFEKIVKIAYVKGECKRKDVISKLKTEVMEAYVNVITAIPGLDNHDASALIGSIGSIEALSKASKEFIMENTDLSAEKAELIEKFFKDPKYYLSPKFN
ncbi:protein PARTING DANCERS homolog isoform X2 [Nymphaea colorata]|uniref:protein PARTING DANCERS homolog isoform X2 n=1 Tax=Nymphaea colorata TaxID=210225 RepID=UPI00129E63CE|nr:protein PARTING DANCERS homolog isoform X2 [Nymphaea colorata]